MNKDFFDNFKRVSKKIVDDAKNNAFYFEEKQEFQEIFNYGKKYVKDKIEDLKRDEENMDNGDKIDESSNNKVYEDDKNVFFQTISETYKKVNDKIQNEILNYNKKLAKEKIDDLIKLGIDLGVKEKIKKQISASGNSEEKSYDNKLNDYITKYCNSIDEMRMLVINYQSLEKSEKRNLYNALCDLFKESKNLIEIYNELSNSEKEKYYYTLKFSTLNLYSIINIYNNSYDHSKYEDYIQTFDLYDEIIDSIDDKIVGIIDDSVHLFSKYLYNPDGYMIRYDGLKEKTNRVCIYKSDDLIAIYMDNSDNNYKAMPNGYSYKVSKNIVYTANCTLNNIVDFNRLRYEMYNQDLVIPAYYENDKTTKKELDSVLSYACYKYGINSNKEKIK